MFEKVKHLKVSRKLLYFLTENSNGLEAETIDNAFKEAEIYPNRKTTSTFLDKFILSIGVIFMVCGVIFFFAYNWADLHKFIKLGLVMAILIATGIFTALQKQESYTRKIGLVALCGLTGAFFALFGQIYQTGANAYDFFMGWTALVTLWVIVSRFSALWVFYLVLANTTAILYAGQVHRLWESPNIWVALLCFNVVCWVVWEYLSYNNKLFTKSRLFPRIVGLGSIILTTTIGQMHLFEFHRYGGESYGLAYTLNWLLLIAMHVLIAFIVYRHKIKDLFFLGLSVVGMIWIGTAITIRIFDSFEAELFFFLSLLVIIATFLAVKWLIKVNREWKEEEMELAGRDTETNLQQDSK